MAKTSVPNIYKFYSARAFLRECLNAKKSANPGFSTRAWAKHLGLKTHTVLHAVLNGERNTPISMYSALCRNLNLGSEEAHVLLLLINIENAKDQYSRLMLIDKLETLKKKKNFSMHELADFDLLSDPFWGFLIELTDRRDFVNDADWIKSQTRIPKSSAEIRSVISTLIEKGLLKLEGDRLTKTHQHTTNVHDLANIGSRKYHRNASFLAAEMVEQQPVQEREFNGYALNVRKRDMDKMKSSLRAFIKDFIIEFEAAPGEGDATYQLNTQLFNLSRPS